MPNLYLGAGILDYGPIRRRKNQHRPGAIGTSASVRPSVTFLDGDTLRTVVSNDLGYSEQDRRSAAMRNGMLCRMLAEQGHDVVCATISLFHDVHRWNRENIPRYNEIFVRVSWEELRRDSKGVYSGNGDGPKSNIVGLRHTR